MKTTILYNQSLLDIALEQSGRADNLVYLAHANDLNPTDIPAIGSQMTKPSYKEQNQDIISYYKAKDLKPTTAKPMDLMALLDFGIGLMEIEDTFIIR